MRGRDPKPTRTKYKREKALFQREIACSQRVFPLGVGARRRRAPTKGAQDFGISPRKALHLVPACGADSSRRRPLQVGQHPLDPRTQLFGRHLLAEALHHQRKRERRRPRQQPVLHLLAPHAAERLPQPPEVQFLLQDLALGLRQQPVARVVLAEHLVEQARARLQLLHRLRRPGIALEDQSRHPGHLAEPALREFARVQAGQHVVEQALPRRAARPGGAATRPSSRCRPARAARSRSR